MTERFTDWLVRSHVDFEDYVNEFFARELERKRVVFKIQYNLYQLATSLGQTPAQARNKIDELFSTFAAEWSLYVITGSPAINTAVSNDATIAWLDVDVQGTSLRQRILNRLV